MFKVPEKLLPFLVLCAREECTDERFDRVTHVVILGRCYGPACPELLLKRLFPPFRFAKEREEFVRHILETSSTEGAQDFSEFVIGIHGCLPLSIDVPLMTLL